MSGSGKSQLIQVSLGASSTNVYTQNSSGITESMIEAGLQIQIYPKNCLYSVGQQLETECRTQNISKYIPMPSSKRLYWLRDAAADGSGASEATEFPLRRASARRLRSRRPPRPPRRPRAELRGRRREPLRCRDASCCLRNTAAGVSSTAAVFGETRCGSRPSPPAGASGAPCGDSAACGGAAGGTAGPVGVDT